MTDLEREWKIWKSLWLYPHQHLFCCLGKRPVISLYTVTLPYVATCDGNLKEAIIANAFRRTTSLPMTERPVSIHLGGFVIPLWHGFYVNSVFFLDLSPNLQHLQDFLQAPADITKASVASFPVTDPYYLVHIFFSIRNHRDPSVLQTLVSWKRNDI